MNWTTVINMTNIYRMLVELIGKKITEYILYTCISNLLFPTTNRFVLHVQSLYIQRIWMYNYQKKTVSYIIWIFDEIIARIVSACSCNDINQNVEYRLVSMFIERLIIGYNFCDLCYKFDGCIFILL